MAAGIPGNYFPFPPVDVGIMELEPGNAENQRRAGMVDDVE